MTARMTAPPAGVAPAPPAPARPRPEIGGPGGAPRLRVVADGERTPEATRRRARLLAGSVALLAALALFGVVAAQVAITQRQFQLERVARQGDELQQRYDRLRLQVAELESPARVVAAATALGMQQPGAVTYLTPDAPPAAAPHLSGPEPEQTTTSWQTVKPHLVDR